MTEQELDLRLRSALLQAARAEYARPLPGEEASPAASPALRRRLRPLLADPFGRRRRLHLRAARSAAAVFLAAVLTAGAVLAVSPEARAWVRSIFVEVLAEYSTIRFVRDPGGQTGELGTWAPAWLPEGYALLDAQTDPYHSLLTYGTAQGSQIYFECTNSPGAAFHVDNEHHEAMDVPINGCSGYLLQAVVPGHHSSLIWYDQASGTAFSLLAELPPEDLIRIAESVAPR